MGRCQQPIIITVTKCGKTNKVGLGDMEKIKYHDIFDQIPRYRNDIVVLTIGAFTKYLHNEIFDE